MDKLDKKLHRLSKIEPSKGFMKASKKRLMQRIVLQQNENWFKAFLKKMGRVSLPASLMSQVRLRLMNRITHLPVKGLAFFFNYTKKLVASTLVMLIAITSALFFIEGDRIAEASDDSYLEVTEGDVFVKHPDFIVWEEVKGVIEVQAGDLIKTKENSRAVVRFFDDTELRLAENTTLLISQLNISPGFGRQAVITGSLHKGKAWVQTLNAEDGYAGFTLFTRNASVRAVNAAFNVSAGLAEPTLVYLLNNKAELTSLMTETRQAVKSIRLSAKQKASVNDSGQNPVIHSEDLTQQDLANEWVQSNLNHDDDHLAVLRKKEVERLTQTAGTLPGQMLYPIKQAKERLKLAFSADSDLDVQIEIANRRLNEAIVLFESGQSQKGQEALIVYQSVARRIGEMKGAKKLAGKLIVPHQKILTAQLPGSLSDGLVKEALHQTAEILADSPIELEKVRLANSVQRLQDATMLAEEGDFEAAKKRLASYGLEESNALTVAEALEDEALKKVALRDILAFREEEMTLLRDLSELLGQTINQDKGLVAMVDSAFKTAEEDAEVALVAALPFFPELSSSDEVEPETLELDPKMAQLIEKIYIYKSWTGQKNQIERLLKNELKNPSGIAYLKQVRGQLSGRAYDYMNVQILRLQKEEDLQKHKAMQRKIERSKRLRQNPES